MFNKDNKAFTLIELLVVISIIGLLSSIVLVSTKGVREKAKLERVKQYDLNVQQRLEANAVGIWRFEAVDGTPLMTSDESGYGNHGELKGGMTKENNWDDVDGVYPNTNAMYFDGDDYIDCGNDSSLDITGDITMAMWIRIDEIIEKPMLLHRGSNATDGYYFMIYDDGHFLYRTNQAGETQSTRSAKGELEKTGQWYFLVATRNGITGKLYKDGIDVTYTTEDHLDPTSSNRNLYIGNFNYSEDPFFCAEIDDVRIYETALSTAEIQQHYAEGAKKYGIAGK